MHLLKIMISYFIAAVFISCSKGGPVTPLESYNSIKSSIEARDSEAILKNLSSRSIEKIDTLDKMIKQMREDQLESLAKLYSYEPSKLKNMKRSDYVSLYFFVKHGGTGLSVLFSQKVLSVDINGSNALIRTASGVELGFVREGPYWKLDISDL